MVACRPSCASGSPATVGSILAGVCVSSASSAFSGIRFFFFQAEDGIRDIGVTGVQTCALPIYAAGKTALSEPVFSTEGCGGFAPTQSLGGDPAQAGGSTSITLNMERPEGQQFLSSTRTVLPPGLVGNIPAASQCSQLQIDATACPASSQIGTVTALSGSGPEPFPFHGTVYLAGPGGGAPYRLAVFVPIVAGPFNLGVEKTIVSLAVDKTSAQ